MKTTLSLIAFFVIVLYSCLKIKQNSFVVSFKDKDGSFASIKIQRINDSFYRMETQWQKNTDSPKVSSLWPLPYPVFKLEIADMDNDSNSDVLVGVIKATRFDPVIRKRLFAYQFTDGTIRPLWLSSRLGQPLYDFTSVIHDKQTFIQSIELERDNTYLVAEYKWQVFGLRFRKYIARNVSLSKAKELLGKV